MIKRKVSLFMIMFLLTWIFIGCSVNNDGASGVDGEDIVTFEATVLEHNGCLLVTPVEGSSELNSSDKIYVSLANSEEDQDNQLPKFNSGDVLEIRYDGLIAESYPAQITASKVEILGRNLLIDGYFAIIDDLYNEDVGLNSGISMIAFDTSKWINLSKAEMEVLFNIVKEKYKLDVINATFEDLEDQGLIINDGGKYFDEGILIELTNLEYKDSKELIATVGKWRSGDGGVGWDAKASYKDDNWQVIRDNTWIS